MSEFVPLFGYAPNPAGTAEFVATLPRPMLAQAGPDLAIDEGRDVFLGSALLRLCPSWKRGRQVVGSCVGWGWAMACDVLAACDIVLRGEAESFGGLVLPASIYGFSRVEARGQEQNNGGDGSYGGAAAKAVTQFGTLHYGIDYGGDNQWTENSGSLERAWGRYGVPNELEPYAAQHKVSHVAVVESFEDAAKAIQNGYSIAVCSMMGFSMTLRQGYMTPMGQWPHCQMALGVRWKPEPAILVANSWSDCYTGTFDESLPPAFQRSAGWVKADDFTRMVQGGDSFALSGYAGFSQRELPGDWLRGVL